MLTIRHLPLAAVCLGLLLPDARAQHGVIREYAALAPKSDAHPLLPLFDAALTDTSIVLGPDKAYYITGSAIDSNTATFASRTTIWRSADMKQWIKLRTLDQQAGNL